MKVTSIDHFVITTHNIDKSIAFYQDLLGMKHVEKDGRHAFIFGHQKINIHAKKGEFQPAALHPEYGSQDFCLIVEEDVESIKKEIEKKGYPIVEGVVKRHGAQGDINSLYLRDPDGNLVELANYRNN